MHKVDIVFYLIIIPSLLILAVIGSAVISGIKVAREPRVAGRFLGAAALVYFVLARPYSNEGIFGKWLHYLLFNGLSIVLTLVGLTILIKWAVKTSRNREPEKPAESAVPAEAQASSDYS